MKKITNLTNKLLNSQTFARELLPIDNSIIAYEIILTVMFHHYSESDLTFKILLSSKNFTEMGARYNLTKLRSKGWVDLKVSKSDSRSRVIVPSVKLISRFANFLDLVGD